jgi:hypothetical protein
MEGETEKESVEEKATERGRQLKFSQGDNQKNVTRRKNCRSSDTILQGRSKARGGRGVEEKTSFLDDEDGSWRD